MSFADLGLSEELLRAVTDSGYNEPTPIQRQAIPSVLMNRDLIGIAQTGTGKTASFVLPMIDILAQGRGRARMPRSLILEPTRELAAQVAENFEKYGKYHKLNMALLIGGVSFGDQDRALEKGVDVLIATPGRLMDQFARGKILMSGVDILVIDEADRMLDMGFIPDIESICSKLPARRQTLLFSATMPPPIKKLADRFLSSPKTIEVSRPATANTSITQSLVETTPRGKRETLRRLLRAEDVTTAIIFANRKSTVRDLATSLKRHGFSATQIHGDMDQSERLREMERFKNDEVNVLVASDVAARGIDVKGVSHVFNFDIPWQPDDYIHRIGRTGRGGATGKALSLITPDDAEAVAAIEKLIGRKIDRIGTPGAKPAATEEKVDARPEGKRGKSAAGKTTPSKAKAAKTADKTDADVAAAKPQPTEMTEKPASRRRAASRKGTAPADQADSSSRPASKKSTAATPPSAPNAAPETQAARHGGEDVVVRKLRQSDNYEDNGWYGPIPAFLAFKATSEDQ